MSTALTETTLLRDILVVDPIDPVEFREFTEALDQIDMMIDPTFYLEVVNSTRVSTMNKLAQGWDNTKDTTKTMMKGYGDVTDGGGSLMKASFDFTFGLINLIAKAIKFILSNMAKMINFIIKVGKRAKQIPPAIIAKMRGDIQLYITIADLPMFTNNIMPKIEDFMMAAKEFSKGEMWGTFWNRDGDDRSSKANKGLPHHLKRAAGIPSGRDDMALSRKMESYYNFLAELQFTPTTVKMNNPKIKFSYFGDPATEEGAQVKFYDRKRGEYVGSYYDALAQIIKDFDAFREPLTILQEDIGKKIDRTVAEGNFGHLSNGAKERIRKTMQMLSKVINIIGSFIRYVTKDMNTITATTNKLLEEAAKQKAKATGQQTEAT